MNRQVKGLLYFFLADMQRSFYIFWGILLGFVTLGVLIAAFLLTGDNDKMVMGLSIAVYIYSAIFGFHAVKQSIPFALKMGATRKNLYIGLGIFLLGLAVLQALIANLIQSIYEFICQLFSIHSLEFMSLAEFLNNTWLTQFTIDATMIFFIMIIGLMLGLLFYKYGLPGGGGVIGVVMIVLLFGLAEGFLKDFFVHMGQSFNLASFFQLAGVGLVLYLLSWVFIRKITIKS